MSEFTIELKRLDFFSFHGLYEEERKVGGEFIVDIIAKYTAKQKPVTLFDEIINYAALYEIVKEEMNHPRALLETLAQSIAEKIQHAFPLIREIEIRIEKKNPPIASFRGSVAVTYKK